MKEYEVERNEDSWEWYVGEYVISNKDTAHMMKEVLEVKSLLLEIREAMGSSSFDEVMERMFNRKGGD